MVIGRRNSNYSSAATTAGTACLLSVPLPVVSVVVVPPNNPPPESLALGCLRRRRFALLRSIRIIILFQLFFRYCWVPPEVYRSCTAGHYYCQQHHFPEQSDSACLMPERNIFSLPTKAILHALGSANPGGTGLRDKNCFTPDQGTEKENNFCFLKTSRLPSVPSSFAQHSPTTVAAAPTFCLLFSRCSLPSSILLSAAYSL